MKNLFKLLAVLLSLVFCGGAFAADITLQWTPNSEKDLAGYRLFVKKVPGVYDYSKPTWEGSGVTCEVKGLDDTEDYFFVLRAYDAWGNESRNSNEVRLYRGQTPDKVAPAEPKLETITIIVGP